MKNTKVFAIGVFDLFHVGHLRYLQYAKTQGDFLLVGVAEDHVVETVKHKLPQIPIKQRVEILQALDCVDQVIPFPVSLTYFPDIAIDFICTLNVDIIVVGGEWQGSGTWKKITPILEEKGMIVRFAPHTEGISTTKIMENIIKTAKLK